jgi:hypothetical protein
MYRYLGTAKLCNPFKNIKAYVHSWICDAHKLDIIDQFTNLKAQKLENDLKRNKEMSISHMRTTDSHLILFIVATNL